MRISKIALKFSFVVILLLLSAIFILSTLIVKLRTNSFIREMEVKAKFFARSTREAIFPKKDMFQLHFALTEILKEKGIIYASIFNDNGKVIDHSNRNLIGYSEKTPWALKGVRAKKVLTQIYRKGKEKFYDIAIPIFIGNKKIGGVRIGFSQSSVEEALKSVRYKIFTIAIVIIIIGVVVTFIVVGFMVKPINSLAYAARKIGEGNLDVKVKESGNDEIGELSRTFNDMVKGLAEREFLRDTFGKYVNPEVANRALRGELKLGGEKRIVTMLLSDIRGFTSKSESMEPEELVKLLNNFFNLMVEEITKNKGNIDKYIGDAIMAEFGAPLDMEDHAFKAVISALGMRKKLKIFNEKFNLNWQIGIGIHTGEVISGNIGSDKKMEYTCIGDTVNVSARIEPLNKKYKTDILISEETYNFVKDRVEVELMGEEVLRGKTESLKIYYLKGIRNSN